MKVALRPSGGRGEYELAGTQGGVHASDLIEKDITYEFAPDLVVPSGTQVRHLDGKTRLRTVQGGVHGYRAITALLLLPKPIREIRRTSSGAVNLSDKRYSVLSIDVDVSEVRPGSVILRPTALMAGNSTGNTRNLGFVSRLDRIERVWAAARTEKGELALLVRNHEQAIRTCTGDFSPVEHAAQAISAALHTQGDPLESLERRFVGESEPQTEEPRLVIPEDDPTTSPEAKRRLISEWRLQASRGAKGRAFSLRVREAYNHRCLFSGTRLPTTTLFKPPGVVAAHILPWRHYELDGVNNGLCLNHLCHWGFDVGLLRLDYDSNNGDYSLSIPTEMVEHARVSQADIEYFRSLAGPVPRARLPHSTRDWPSPRYLKSFNEAIAV